MAGQITIHYFGEKAEGTAETCDFLSLSVTESYVGYYGLPVWTVAYGEYDAYNSYAEPGEEDQGCWNMLNSEMYLREADALAAYEKRKNSAQPWEALLPRNTLAELAVGALKSMLQPLQPDGISVKTIPNQDDDHFWFVVKRFLQADSSYYEGQHIFLCLVRAHTKGCSDSLRVMLPAWKLLELKVAMVTMTKLLLTMQAGSNAKSWAEYYEDVDQFEFSGPVREIVDKLTTTSREHSDGWDAVMVPVLVDELHEHLKWISFTALRVYQRLCEKKAA